MVLTGGSLRCLAPGSLAGAAISTGAAAISMSLPRASGLRGRAVRPTAWRYRRCSYGRSIAAQIVGGYRYYERTVDLRPGGGETNERVRNDRRRRAGWAGRRCLAGRARLGGGVAGGRGCGLVSR